MSVTQGSNSCAQRAKIVSLLKTAEILARDLLDVPLTQSIDRAIEDACIGQLSNRKPFFDKVEGNSRTPVQNNVGRQPPSDFAFSWKALGADLWSSLRQRPNNKGSGGLPS